MSDAAFIFETNITEVVGQIRSGLQQVASATSEAAGSKTGDLIRQVAPDVTRDVEAALVQYRRLHEGATKAFALGDSLAGGSLARQAGEIASQLTGQIRQHVSTAATAQTAAGGEPFSTSELNAALKGALTPVEQLKAGAEELVSTMQRFAGALGAQAYGTVEELNNAARANKNIGTPTFSPTHLPDPQKGEENYLRVTQQAAQSIGEVVAAAALHSRAERNVADALNRQATAAEEHARTEHAPAAPATVTPQAEAANAAQVPRIAPDVTRDVEAAMVQYRRLHEEATKAFGNQDFLAGGSFARQAGGIASGLAGQIRQKVGDAATEQIAAGQPVSTAEINAALKAALAPVEQLKAEAEELVSTMQRFAGEMGVQTYGSLEELNKAAKAGATNVAKNIEKGTFVPTPPPPPPPTPPTPPAFSSTHLPDPLKGEANYLNASQQAARSMGDVVAAAALQATGERTVADALGKQAVAAEQQATTADVLAAAVDQHAQGEHAAANALNEEAAALAEILPTFVEVESAARLTGAALILAAEDIVKMAKAGQEATNGIVRLGSNPKTADIANKNTGQFFDAKAEEILDPILVGQRQALLRDTEAAAASAKAKFDDAAAATEAKKTKASETAASRQLATSEKALAEENSKGLGRSFLAGALTPGFGSKSSFDGDFSGLARSAGQAVKYSTLYQTLGLLQQAAGSAVKQFLNFDDSIVELQVSMRTTDQISADFVNGLQNIAAVGGFNVGDAMDVAASGIRAFGDAGAQTDQQMQQLGVSFAEESNKIAVLTKTTLADASGNLKSIAFGFNLPKNQTGFQEVADALAGAKVLGGGNEKDIGQGLATGAITFGQQLGFSLKESASLISQIVAQTDESGQTAATRVTRLADALGGASGKKTLADLNAQLGPGQQIDTTAPLRDQILQLATAYKTLPSPEQQRLIGALGGTQQGKELIVLLNNADTTIQKIKEDAAKGGKLFDGAADKEFANRLDNARAQINQIAGNLNAVVTNLGRSGLAEPFVAIVSVLNQITYAMREATQFTSSLVGQLLKGASALNNMLGPLKTIAGYLGGLGGGAATLAGGLYAASRVRAAGGLGQFAAGTEARFLPTAALARQQLADGAGQRQAAAAAAAIPKVVNSEELGAQLKLAQAELVKADALLAESAKDLGAKAAQTAAALKVAQGELSIAQNELRGISTNNLAFLGARKNVDAASGKVISATADSEVATANLLKGKEIEEEFNTKRQEINQGLLAKERTIAADINAASLQGAAGATRVAELEAERATLQNDTNIALAAVTKEELAVRFKMVTELNGLSVLAAAPPVGKIRGFANELKGLFTGVTGALIIGTVAVEVAGKLKEASDKLNEAQRAARVVANNPIGTGVAGLRNTAQQSATAAAALDAASSGFFGGLVARLGTTDTDALRNEREASAKILNATADAIEKLNQGQVAGESHAQQFAGRLDLSSTDALTQTLKGLQDEGVSADSAIQALNIAINSLSFAADAKAGDLTLPQRRDLSANVAQRGIDSLGNREKAADDAINKASRLPAVNKAENERSTVSIAQRQAINDAADKARQFKAALGPAANREAIQNTLQQTLDTFQADYPQASLNTPDVQAKLKKAYLKSLSLDSLGLSPQAREIIAQDTIRGLGDDLTEHGAAAPGTLGSLRALAAAAPALADKSGADATTRSKLKTESSGGRDISDLFGAQRRVDELTKQRANLQAKADALVAGGTDEEQAYQALKPVQDDLDQAVIALFDAKQQYAQNLLQESKAERTKELAAAKGKGAKAAIASTFFTRDLDTALDSGSVDLIIGVIEQASASEIALAKKSVQEALRAKEAEAAAASATLLAAQAASDALGAAATVAAAAGDPDTSKETRGGRAGAGAAARITAAAGPNATIQKRLLKAQADWKNIQIALGETSGGPGYAAGGGGKTEGTDAQIAAAQEAATADRQRNSLGAAKAAVDAAKADIGAAKTTLDKVKAEGQYAQALNAYKDALQAAKSSVSRINAFPDSALQSATFALNEAKLNVNKFAKGTVEWAAAQAAFVQSTRQLQQAQVDLNISRLKLASDLTDPVAQAKINTKAALSKLQLDTRNKQPVDVLATDQLALRQSQYSEEAAAFSQNLQAAQTSEQLGRTSHAAYLSYLKGEHDRLTNIQHKTQQQTDELNQIDQAIKSANSALQGQWNLGDIKVPTVYEMRRAVQNATAASSVIANTTSAVTNNVTINGADFAKVVDYLTNTLGSSGSGRLTTSTRRA